MKRRPRLTAAIAGLLLIPTIATAVTIVSPASATLPAPVILNTGLNSSTDAAWLEHGSLPDEGGSRVVTATFLVEHPVGRTITHVRYDANWNGTVDAGTAVAVTEKAFAPAAGGLQTSRVTAHVTIPNGPNLSGRSFNAPFRMRVQDNTGEQSASVTNQMRFVENGNGLGSADFPRLTQTNQIVDPPDVAPSTAFTVQYTCDDVDSNSSLFGVELSFDDNCAGAQPRWRRLNDGTVQNLATTSGGNDNTLQTLTVNTPSTRGYWVLETLLCNEDGACPTNGAANGATAYHRLGAVIVNNPATTLGNSWSTTGTQPSTPPSVNPGDIASVIAAPTETGTNATVQVVEWDSANDGTFERREYTVPSNTGGDIGHPPLGAAELTQAVDTSTHGLKTVTARFTDNGSIDAADQNRRQLTSSTQIRVNAVPVAHNVSTGTDEDTAVTVNLSATDSDNQPETFLTYSLASSPPPSQGTLGPISGNTVVFTPAANYNGPVTFTVRADDGTPATVGAHKASAPATVTINVAPVNDNPTIIPNSGTTTEDNPGDVQVTGTDIEDTPSQLTYDVSTQPTNGSAACTPSGLCTYSPNLNFHGTDSYIVTGTDTQGGTGTATITMTVTPVNDAPVANNQTVNVPEDSVNFGITLSGTDVDNLVLNYTGPNDDVDHGTLTCAGQACSYTPAPNYNGPDSFTFTVDDGSLSDLDGATVTINVTAVNDAPVAIDRTDVETDEDTPVTSTLSGTDIDVGDVVTVDHATDGPSGTTQVVGPNDVKYTPDLNFYGVDTYGFTVTDSNGGFDDGTVTVTVHPVNDAPFLPNQPFTIAEDNPTILSVFAGDVDGDLLDWSVAATPSHGSIVGIGPDLVYIPDVNYVGDDTFQLSVTDGDLSATGTITVHVAPVNDQPVANSATITTAEDLPVTFTLSASDPDGGALSFTAPQAGPVNGGAVCTGGGSCTYTPAGDFNGADQFQFTASDGFMTDTASITILVAPVNDAPTVDMLLVATDEDTPVGLPIVAQDIDGDTLTYSVDAPLNGSLSGIAPDLVYLPNTNWSGTETLNVTVDDGQGGTASSIIGITVNAVNDAPIATGGTVATDEEQQVGFQLGGADVEGGPLTYTVDEAPPAENGTLACDSTGACTFDPADDVTGEQLIAYTVSDGSLTSSGVFTVIVGPVNDPPVADDSTVTTPEDEAADIPLGATDTEGDALTYSVVSPPSHGDLVCEDAGCVYTPASNFNGTDAFTWAANDGTAGSNNATVSITVDPVNDAPSALDVAQTTDEDIVANVALLATDVDGDPLAYSVDSAPAHGSVTVAGAVATYTPALNYIGTDSFTYRVTDPSGASSVATVTMIVEGVPLIGTSLTAAPSVVKVKVVLLQPHATAVLFPGVQATLKTASGAPLAGRQINFSIGTTPICTATTNAQGVGGCSSNILTSVQSLLNLGYSVSFSGDDDYAASTARGPLTQVIVLAF